MSRLSRISLAPAFLLVLAAGLLTGPLTATAGMGKRFGSAPGGTLYVSTNLPSGNSIVAYRYDGNGRLNLIPNGVFPLPGALS